MKKLSDAILAEEEKLDLTPLIDVIFMLLLFFVVTTTFAEDTFFPIELPGARNAEPAEVPVKSQQEFVCDQVPGRPEQVGELGDVGTLTGQHQLSSSMPNL